MYFFATGFRADAIGLFIEIGTYCVIYCLSSLDFRFSILLNIASIVSRVCFGTLGRRRAPPPGTYDVKRREANDDVVTDLKSERDYVVTGLLV